MLGRRKPPVPVPRDGLMYPMVIWDFDGTLVDSLGAALNVFNGMAREHRFLPVSDTGAARGMTTIGFIRAHRIPWLRIPRLIREFLGKQADNMPSIRLFDRVKPLLDDLRAKGCRMGIVSSNKPENIEICLEANGVLDRFEFVVGVQNITGKTRALKKVIRRFRTSASEAALYVGDEARDIRAARRAGLDVAAVAWGLNDEAMLRKFGPTHVCASPDELRRIVLTDA
jgi:phosphoglycolate phosphatase